VYIIQRYALRGLMMGLILILSISPLWAHQQSQQTGTLRGKVTDELGGLLIGTDVTVTGADGVAKKTQTNDEGAFTVSDLKPGQYSVRIVARNFVPYENGAVSITAGHSTTLDLKLGVTIDEQQVTITEEPRLNTSPENNAGGILLRDKDLDRLPDNPDELTAYLQALAGPGAGPNGAQVIVDGFTGGRVPTKDSIREVRINRNPFSAEYERMGFGRIEITTRAGTDRFRGQGFFDFNDESLNARNPFAPNRPSYQDRFYGGSLSGPVIAKKSAFYFGLERRETDENAFVNATILDAALLPVSFNQAVLTPQRYISFGPRVDYQLNPNNTFIARYGYTRSSFEGAGVGGFSLPSRAFNGSSNEHLLRLTETAVLSARLVNEARFQFIRRHRSQQGDNTLPGIVVLDAFTGGGSQVGLGFNDEDRAEFSNFDTLALGNQTLRMGVRMREVRLRDFSPQNFGGTFLFTSLDQYRQALSHVPGARPEQLTINGGNPSAGVNQFDIGLFAQDDWKLRPNFTLSLGLRYERQTNIHSAFNFAPRVSFAWAPGAAGGRPPQTVIRGGYGIFYDRFAENFTLQANRFNGLNQQQFVVTDPRVLDLFPVVPTTDTLAAFALPPSKTIVAPDLQTPYSMQSAISVERRLPFDFNLSFTFINSRTVHALRSRNINAPIPGSGVRPLGNIGNVFAFESSGFVNQNQLIISAEHFSRTFRMFASYGLNKATGDTDGPFTFPANSYDLRGERGPSSLDIRHYLFIGGGTTLPWDVNLNLNMITRSGVPYNITTGLDTNGDNLFTERPAFATNLSKPGVIITPLGAFDPNPGPGDVIVPRNFGRGPAFLLADIVLDKNFRFGHVPGTHAPSGPPPGAPGPPPGAPKGGPPKGEQYSLNFSIIVSNFINRVNFATPIGNLSSPFFGLSNATAGGFGFGGARVDFGGNPPTSNRRITFRLRFSF
jgi:hypothetical protein